jgi:N,N'-diacetylchitobiose transport system permease protein
LRRVFEQREFGRYFLDSLVVAGTAVIFSAVIAFLAATAVTRFRFRFRTTSLIMFLVAQTVPVEVADDPAVLPRAGLCRLNAQGALIPPHIAFSLPFAIWSLWWDRR